MNQKLRSNWALTLYIAGQQHAKSASAFSNLKRICEEHVPGKYILQIIDLSERPERVAEDQILAVPTLIRNSPAPVRRIIGDLSDTEKVLVSLDLLGIGPASSIGAFIEADA